MRLSAFVEFLETSQKSAHAVVVDGVTVRNGQPVVAIRDPHGKAYFSPLKTFEKNFSGHMIVIGE